MWRDDVDDPAKMAARAAIHKVSLIVGWPVKGVLDCTCVCQCACPFSKAKKLPSSREKI